MEEITTPSPAFDLNQEKINNLSDTLKTNAAYSSEYNNYILEKTTPNPFDVFNDSRIAFKEYTIDKSDVYKTLNSGEGVAMFDSYIPGVNNMDRLARMQSTTDKWLNGLAKFGGKTFNAVVGGTLGVINGVGKLAMDGSLTSLYDNEFNRTLDDWNTKLDYNLPNYYTAQETEKGLFGQAGTANFWADKVLGGLSFTAGAIVSEGIWAFATGGASLGTTAARWGTRGLGFTRLANGINTYKGFLKAPLLNAYRAGQISKTTAIALGRAGDALNTARFMMTSAGYEASVEALQYKKEATENFYNNFAELNGREPNQEDIQQFTEDLENSANAVFGVNMGIVGSSNLLTLGHIFNLKNPIRTGIGEFIEKKAFGRGITSTVNAEGKTIYSAIEATRPQKIARNIYLYGRAPIVEGLYEEGGQGVTSKTAKKWLEYSYNPLLATENAELSGLVYESLAEQYGTKEGWVENGIGMIIGAIGGSVNTRAGINRQNAEQEFRIAGLNTYQQKVIGERFLMANQMNGFAQEAEQEAQQGNIVRSRIATDGVLHARLNHAYQLGEDLNGVVEEAKLALDAMTPSQFNEAGVASENIETFKEEVISEYSNVAKQFQQNRKYAEYIIGRNPIRGAQEVFQQGEQALATNNQEALIQSLTWTLTAGENAAKLMNDIQGRIGEELGTEQSRVITTISQLNRQQANRKGQITKSVNKRKALIQERDRLQSALLEVQNAPRETEGDRVQGRELGQLNLRIIEVENQISSLDNELQGFADLINGQQQYQQGIGEINIAQNISGNTISVDDLTNLSENLNKFRSLVNSLRTVNPQRHQYLTDLLDEYTQAEELFNTNQSTAIALSSGQIQIKNLNTWLAKKLNKNGNIDEVTKEWLTDILTKYEQNKVVSSASTLEQEDPISDEIYEEFVNNNVAPQEILTNIANKIRQQTALSEREKAIYESRKIEIENYLREAVVANTTPAQTETRRSNADIVNELAQDNYLLTHITTETDALDIFNSDFTFNVGSGLSGTATLLGENGVNEQIEKILAGQSPHRGLTGMVIIAIPKSLFDQERVSSDDIENFLIERNAENPGLIPNEFIVAYFTEGQLKTRTEQTQPIVAPQNTTTQSEQLRQRLENLLSNGYNSLTYIGTNYDDLYLQKPTRAEIEEYRILLSDNIDNERFQFLQNKLGNWRLLDSAVTDENQSIVDLIDLINQLETQIDQENTLDELTPEDLESIVQADKNGVVNNVVRYDFAQNTRGSVTVQYLAQKGIYKFSHLKMSSIMDALGITANSDRVKALDKNKKVIKKPDFNNYEAGTIFYVDNTKFVIGTGNTIEIFKKDYENFMELLGVFTISSPTKWSYSDVYELAPDGTAKKRPSDFQENINAQLAYEIQPNEELGFQIANDEFNAQLRDRVLNEEPSEELEKTILNSLKIYVTYKGQPIATLKGISAAVPNDNFLLLREKAKQAFLANPNSPILRGKIKLKQIFIGNPQITTFNKSIISEAPDVSGASNVISTGYVQDGQITLSRQVGEVDLTYISGIQNTGKKIPVIVFKRGKYNIAYPVSLQKSGSPMAAQIESIVENTELSPVEKVKAINNRIIETGIAADKRLTEYNEEQIQAIIDDFAANQTFVSMDDFSSPNYRLANLSSDILVNIDLNNISNVISDPKIELDLNSIEILTTREDKYESLVEVEERASDLMIELNLDFTRNADTKYINSKGEIIEGVNYTNVFDDGLVINNPTSHNEKLRNVNALKQAFSEELPKIVKNAIGAQKIQEIDFLLKKIEFLRSQTTPNRQQAQEGIDENTCG